MFALLIASGAWALPCPAVPTLVEQARAAFDDAELDRAEAQIAEAYENLECQSARVPTETLLDLYRMSALVALSRADREGGAVYSTIRAVVVDPTAVPPAELGPQLAELFETWSARLDGKTLSVGLEGSGDAFVDGRPVTAAQPLQVLAGEHLLQWTSADGFRSEIVELKRDYTLVGVPVPAAATSDVAEPSVSVAGPVAETDGGAAGHSRHRHHPAMFVAAGTAFLAGGGTLAFGRYREGLFNQNPYDASEYGGCAIDTSDCYANARQEAIVADGARVRLLYIAGYATTGVGVALLGTELWVLPSADGGSLGLRGRW